MDLRSKAPVGLLIFLIILISTLPIAPFSLTAYVNGEYSPDRVVVGFKIRIPGDFEAKIRGFGGSVLSKNDKINFVIASTLDPDRFIAAIKNIPEVMYAERDPIAYALDFTPNDAYYSSQWGPQDIYAPAAWDTTKGSSSVIIAIVDTGIDYNHPDLAANVWTNSTDGTHGYNFVSSNKNPLDDNGHGTHCSGIAAAVINNGVGIAGISQSSIMAVKVLDSTGRGYDSDVANGITWAANHGAKIISISLGSSSSSTVLQNAVTYAYNHNCLLVAAAGNSGNGKPVSYPAMYDQVIAVSALNQGDTLASYSSTGSKVELSAPGTGIYSTMPTYTVYLNGHGYGYSKNYASLSGTSMACPHVTGVAALVLALKPSLSNINLRNILDTTAVDLGPTGRDSSYGYGKIDAARTLEPMTPTDLTATADSPTEITLIWTDNSGNEDGFEIERSLNGVTGPYYHVATVPADTTTYENMGLLYETEYTYQIRAYNSVGSSSYSNSDESTTLAWTGPLENFVIIAMPDTQKYSASYPDIYESQTQWIVDNKNVLNIAFVGHEGDIVDTAGSTTQWDNADAAMSVLEDPTSTHLTDGVTYSVVPGNHDHPTTLYNQYFGVSRFEGRIYYGGHYSSNNENNYVLFDAGGLRFIAVSLDYSPDSNEINWADNIIQTYSDRRAIVISHYILDSDGSWGGQGQIIYDSLKDNPNLFLMLCGHMHGEASRSDTYNGNTIYTLLADYQDRTSGGNGWLRMLEFHPLDDEVHAKTYSPYLSQYETDADSTFTLSYDMTETSSIRFTTSGMSNDASGTVLTIDSTAYTYTQLQSLTFSWAPGSTHTVTASDPVSVGSGKRYRWMGWTDGDGLSGVGPGTYTVPASSQAVTVNYYTQYYLTVNGGGHGTVGGANWYDAGTNAQATITPLTVPGSTGVQYVFTGWGGDATGTTSPSNNILMNGPKTATANWKTQYQVSFDVSPIGGGSITNPPSSPQWYDAGATGVIISATPSTGYTFSSWASDTDSITFADAGIPSTTATIGGPGTITARANANPTVNWISTWVYPDNYWLSQGGDAPRGKTLRIYSGISDAETPSQDLTVSISYRSQGGEWTTPAASYNPTWDYWYIDWVIPSGAQLGLYDVKVDVSDGEGGSSSSTVLSQFKVVQGNPVVQWISTWVYPDNYWLATGGDVASGKTLRIYSGVSDAETPSSELTVSISYRPQGGEWTTAQASYNPTWDYWYVDWVIPSGAAAGLYDVKVDVSDPDGGSASGTVPGRFNAVVGNASPSIGWISAWVYPDNYWLATGGDVARGKTLRIYSGISDSETPSGDLTVQISYMPRGGEWTTAQASYNPTWDYWYIDWVIPGGATPGLYDVKVDASDLDGGLASSTVPGQFNVI